MSTPSGNSSQQNIPPVGVEHVTPGSRSATAAVNAPARSAVTARRAREVRRRARPVSASSSAAIAWVSDEPAEVGALLEPLHGGAHRGWPGEPADPQRRSQDLRRAAEPDHPSPCAATGTGGGAVEREQAVRVVLDDEEAVAVGERGQLAAPSCARVTPRGLWKLDTVCTSRGRSPPASRSASTSTRMPSVVERHRVQLGARGLEHLQRADVDRVLDHDGSPGSSRARASRSSACWEPLVTTTWSGVIGRAQRSDSCAATTVAQRRDARGLAVLDVRRAR